VALDVTDCLITRRPPSPLAEIDSERGAAFLTVSGRGTTRFSVPAGMLERTVLGGTMLRTTRGVMSRMISVLLFLSFWEPNRRPTMGRSPKPGRRLPLNALRR